MKQRVQSKDVVFFVLVFLGLSTLILAVNLITNTSGGMSGHALATILAGLMLLNYRWGKQVPDNITIVAFSAIAGCSAVIYLSILQFAAVFNWWLSFEPLKGYEIGLAFAVNALVFAVTMWVHKWR